MLTKIKLYLHRVYVLMVTMIIWFIVSGIIVASVGCMAFFIVGGCVLLLIDVPFGTSLYTPVREFFAFFLKHPYTGSFYLMSFFSVLGGIIQLYNLIFDKNFDPLKSL